MLRFQPGQKVHYIQNGVACEGSIVDGTETVFYPDSTVTKYGNGSRGRAVRGYRVRGPIVSKDGQIYKVRGQMAPGIGYIATSELR